LEVRVRERRPLLSTFQRDGLEEDADGRVTVKTNKGLLSPALSSRGGEGEEAPAHRSGGDYKGAA
jgi:hypothetical protein